MKKWIVLLTLLTGNAWASDAAQLKDALFKASNCKSCDLVFRESGGKLFAEMVNWGFMGKAMISNLPVTIDTDQNELSIQRSESVTCQYEIWRNRDQVILELKRGDENHISCPSNLLKVILLKKSEANIKKSLNMLVNATWSPSNCETCDIVFENINGEVKAKMINWGSVGHNYASNISVSMIPERDRLKLTHRNGQHCFYFLKRNYKNEILAMGRLPSRVKTCPRNMYKR